MKRILLCLLLMLFGQMAMAGDGMPTIHRSGTITTGGTFQSISLPSGQISSLDFQNICSVTGNCVATTDVCYLYFGSGTPTTANSIVVSAGQEYLRSSGSIPNDTIKLTCTGTGDAFLLNLQ